MEVVNLAEMCEILRINKATGAKHWRKWPHFFCTNGRDARSVRFIPDDVIAALQKSSGINRLCRSVEDKPVVINGCDKRPSIEKDPDRHGIFSKVLRAKS